MDNIRPIDANKFEVIGGIIPDGYDADSYLGGCKEILDMIDNAPTLEYPKWISVEERLPEKNSESNGTWCSDTILATAAGYILFGYFYVYKYSGTWEFVCVDEDMDSDRCVTVTHWMPLPEPPKEQEL